VTQAQNNDLGVAFLERLLLLSERSPDRTRPASAAPDYDQLHTAELMKQFQARMTAAERAGAIEFKKGRRERGHLIERVKVKNALALARHLGRSPAQDLADRLTEVLVPVAASGEAWVAGTVHDMARRWARGESAYRLSASAVEGAKEFIALLAAVSKDRARGLDARTFSLKVTGDSKAFDRHAARLAEVLAAKHGETGANADLIWEAIGLERFSHPVHLSGCVLVEKDNHVLVDGRASPFASLHADMLPLLRLCSKPAALLTIENYASFNRYVREIKDDALVVYTSGFPSAAVMELLKLLLTMIDPGVPFFHWGDIDAGGLRILHYLEVTLARAPRPHLMTRALAETRGSPAERDASLGTIAKSASAVAGLAEWLARGERIRHLEQEALDPVSPLATGDDRRALSHFSS
jgi:Uncharacterized protein conserved in bacteria C-term(DUF2220)/Uncharacterized protein conserved in bacteria N-term (DUF3322)